jgi:ABC-type branched-subunit amino acid transport system ATPase component
MFTRLAEGRRMPRPGFANSAEGYYYTVLAVAALTGLAMVVIQRSRLGRVLRGMSDSPTAVTAMGLSVNVSKLLVFSISAFFAGVAGALLGVSRGFAVGGDPFFNPFNSLLLLAMLALAPFAEPWYALVPAIASVIPAYIDAEHTTSWLSAGFGFFAVVVAIQGSHPTMPQRFRTALDRLGRRRRAATVPPPAREHVPVAAATSTSDAAGLVVEDLRVRFGGLVAVDGVNLAAPPGRITGLIGPNGAGKTTIFNACSGLNRNFRGRVLFHGEDVTRASPAARARKGLGRTFQVVELCDSLTVEANVMLGREAGLAGAGVRSQLISSPSQRRDVGGAATSAIELCRIGDIADRQAGTLSTGERRLVELARCLAGPFDVLLLDEPSSGLDSGETTQFGDILRQVVRDRGIGILLVEHDMNLVMRVCAGIYVLDFGKLIFDGTPAEVAASPIVRAAYLGDEAVMAAVADEVGTAAPATEEAPA